MTDQSDTTFPSEQQKVDEPTCGPSCLVNIYQHLGINSSLDKILDELQIDEKQYTHTTQLGRHLLSNGLKATLYTANSYVFSPNWQTKTKQEMIAEMKEWLVQEKNQKSEWLRDTLFCKYFLEEGGEVEITPLTTELLDQQLDDGAIVLGLVEPTWIWKKRKIEKTSEFNDVKGNADGHFVVIFEKDETNYTISDPYPTKLEGKEKIYSVPKLDLLAGIYLRGASFISIQKQP